MHLIASDIIYSLYETWREARFLQNTHLIIRVMEPDEDWVDDDRAQRSTVGDDKSKASLGALTSK